MKKKKIILRALEFYISHRIFRLKNHAKSQDALRVKINVPRIKVNAYSQCITKNKPASWSIPFIENWVCSGHRIGNVKKINGSSVSLIRTVNYLKDNWENSHMKNWRWDLYKTSGNPLGLCTWGQRNHWNYSDKSLVWIEENQPVRLQMMHSLKGISRSSEWHVILVWVRHGHTDMLDLKTDVMRWG